MSDNTDQTQNEQSTVIIPLEACRLYGAGSDRANSSRLETSIINGIKINFGAHIYENNQYRNVSCSMYAIDVYMLFDKVRQVASSTDAASPIKVECDSSVTFDNKTRTSTVVIKRGEGGIWSIYIASSEKGHTSFPFSGIRNSRLTINGKPQSAGEVSFEHLQTWMNTLTRLSGVAMSIIAQERRRELPARGSQSAISM